MKVTHIEHKSCIKFLVEQQLICISDKDGFVKFKPIFTDTLSNYHFYIVLFRFAIPQKVPLPRAV